MSSRLATPAQSPPMIPAEAEPAAFAVEIAGSTPTTLAVETTEPAAVPFVAPLLSAPPMASPFPASDQELVLTPATEADFAETERPVWPSDDRATPPVDENVLFDKNPGFQFFATKSNRPGRDGSTGAKPAPS